MTNTKTALRPLSDFHLSEGKYTVRFADAKCDVEAAQRLRFEVFNLELGEGLPESFATGLDRDIYDAQCSHLLVTHTPTGAVVGTYRMQSYLHAVEHEGFYSAGEFDISMVPTEILAQTMEVGRACIDAGHRNNRVLFLLWKGLTAFLLYNNLRYLFGCCSLTSQDMGEGLRLMAQLKESGHVRADFLVAAKPGYECTGEPATQTIKTPKLFQSYLNYGAKVCSSPAIDRTFKTIDFLVILDKEELSDFSRRLFFPKEYLQA